jgi:hypothetical protein
MSFIQSFRAARWLRTMNLVLQAVLFVTFFAGLNYLSLQYAWRFDLTRMRKHSLSAETRSYLAQLTQPVRVIVTIPNDPAEPIFQQVHRDVTTLLREYVYATEANRVGRVTIETINVLQRPREAEQLNLTEKTVLFLSGEKRRQVEVGELYKFKENKRELFLGEQAFTSAILEVSSSTRTKIYFLSGHGEMDPNGTDETLGLSLLRDSLRERNYDLDQLNLLQAGKIPDDASVIMAIGPSTRFEPLEEHLLRQYMRERAGRLLLFLPPRLHPTGLEELLYEWRLLSDNAVVHDEQAASRTERGDLILTPFVPHPVTQTLVDFSLPLYFGNTRPVRLNPSAPTDPSISVTELIRASRTAWGEINYQRRFQLSENDLRHEKGLAVVAAAERLAAKENLPFSVPVGRMVVFGSADFVGNLRLQSGGNAALFFSSLNWLVDRDAQLSVPPRRIDTFQLAVSREQLLRLRYSLLFALPAAAGLLGLLVYWTRRR